ncbi:MAG: hypothetical protein C4583_12650 [Anaerolineaceae bacterium]|nr:MAG: hypothetical protein C4583_12650 [Anaerolineaceae bacterium]
MSRQSPVVTLEEIPGTKYPDLAAAQQHSLAETASDLTATIRALLESGALVNQNGRIIPNPQG